MSKFLIVALIAAIAISSVYADQSSEAQEVLTCISNLPKPCGTDLTCALKMTDATKCWTDNNCLSKTDRSDYADCIRGCKSDNSAVQTWIDGYANCINGKIMVFASMAFALLVLLF